jgi:hypothetical protein
MMSESCCEGGPFLSPPEAQSEPWVAGCLDHPRGNVLQVKTAWSRTDGLGHFRARTTSFRMRYRVEPGLYAVGRPNAESPVMVTANYKLSFDCLRRELTGLDAWLLVIDTDGINVWCAAGKGTFSTVEVVNRIRSVGLDQIVSHRRIILPQLGAPGVHAHIIQEATGFRVYFGPVLARDIQAYVNAGFKATTKMRAVRFPLISRLILTPMELNPAFKKLFVPTLVLLAFFGLQKQGILFQDLISPGLPFLFLGLISVLIGALLVPLLLPYTPFRSFALKGLLLSAVLYALGFPLISHALNHNPWLLAAAYLLFPALSSYLALNFTGATTFTNISGVKKELRITIPIYITVAALSGVLIIIYKLTTWGIL